MSSIVWLASYPKSGNTWMRMFLTALMSDGHFKLSETISKGIYSSKEIMENIYDLDVDDLTADEIDDFRQETLTYAPFNNDERRYIKIHDAYIRADGTKLNLPKGIEQKVLYIVRNPLDIAPSLANHTGRSIDDAITQYICNTDAALARSKHKTQVQLKQYLGTWVHHVESWKKQKEYPVLAIRYEDMLDNPVDTFRSVVSFLEVNYTEEVLHMAIRATSFDNLKMKEKEEGFKEKFNQNADFFNQGQSGRWKEILTTPQVKKIIDVNGQVMEKMGYLENDKL